MERITTELTNLIPPPPSPSMAGVLGVQNAPQPDACAGGEDSTHVGSVPLHPGQVVAGRADSRGGD